MGWMRANKLKLNPCKMEVLGGGGGGPNLNLGSDVRHVLYEVALPLKSNVHSLEVLRGPELLPGAGAGQECLLSAAAGRPAVMLSWKECYQRNYSCFGHI